jgi:hypothetical protein
MRSADRLIEVWIPSRGHFFALLFLEHKEQQALRQVFLWAMDPKLPAFTWIEANAVIAEIDRQIKEQRVR